MQACFALLILGALCTLSIADTIDEQALENGNVTVERCDNLLNFLAYPRIIQNVTILRTAPLRVRVHVLAEGPSHAVPFTVEGMVCDVGFDQNAANAACRSKDFDYAVLVTGIDWQPPEHTGYECIATVHSHKSVIPCEYILHNLRCPKTATNLAQCRSSPLFTAHQAGCNRYTHVGLICT